MCVDGARLGMAGKKLRVEAESIAGEALHERVSPTNRVPKLRAVAHGRRSNAYASKIKQNKIT